MNKKLTCTIVAGAILGITASSFGAGFRINDQGAKSMAMANAFAAQADDPSALAFNPAGIAFLKGSQVQVGSTTILVPQTDFTGTTRLSGSTTVTEKANRDIFIAPTFYATTSLESIPLSFGLGVNSFFPLAKRWDAGGNFRDSIQEIEIKPINFQPTVAYRFDALKLALAAGLDITYAMASLQKVAYSPFPPPSGPYTALGNMGVDATAVGLGYNVGAQWKPLRQLSFGAAYRSQVKLNLEGDANFAATTAGAAITGPGTTRGSAKLDITLPDVLTLAVAWKPIESLTLEFDAERTGWSSYDKFAPSFGGKLAPLSSSEAKNWEDVWAYRFGTQFAATKSIDLRAGYAYDISPTPDATIGPELPDADRHNFTFGLGLHNDHTAFDMGYMFVHFVDRTVSNPKQTGEYKSDAHLFGVSITAKF